MVHQITTLLNPDIIELVVIAQHETPLLLDSLDQPCKTKPQINEKGKTKGQSTSQKGVMQPTMSIPPSDAERNKQPFKKIENVSLIHEFQRLHLSVFIQLQKEGETKSYHIIPTTASIFALARSMVLKPQYLVERHQVVVCNEDNAIGNGGFFDPLNVRFHQSGTDLLVLVLWKHRKRVHSNGVAVFIMTNCLSILNGQPFVPPVGGHLHGVVRHTRSRGPSGDNMSHQCRARFRLSLRDNRESEET